MRGMPSVVAGRDNAGMGSEDFSGLTFGYLTVVGQPYKNEKGIRFVKCRCVCGNTKTVRISSLKSGKTKSCGCMKGALVSRHVSKHHDSTPTSRYFKLYRVWVEMKQRTRTVDYVDTERRVGVCEEWESWLAFRDWSLSHGYQENSRLTRIDLNEPFSPGNCEWVVDGRFDPTAAEV